MVNGTFWNISRKMGTLQGFKKKIAKIFGGFGQILNFSSFEIAKFI